MRPIPCSMLIAVAAAGVGGAASVAAEPAPSTPAATTPSPTSPAATSPAVPVACAVSGPELDDRRAPLRAALAAGKTIIGLTRDEHEALPAILPRAVRERLEQEGAYFGLVARDGWTGAKVMWRRDRRAKGHLHLTGKRLDAPGGRFRADLDRQYGGRRYSPFVPGSLNFSDPGCWRVKARAGTVRVTYVVLIRRPEPGEFAPYLP